jgi:hypothetical protein
MVHTILGKFWAKQADSTAFWVQPLQEFEVSFYIFRKITIVEKLCQILNKLINLY